MRANLGNGITATAYDNEGTYALMLMYQFRQEREKAERDFMRCLWDRFRIHRWHRINGWLISRSNVYVRWADELRLWWLINQNNGIVPPQKGEFVAITDETGTELIDKDVIDVHVYEVTDDHYGHLTLKHNRLLQLRYSGIHKTWLPYEYRPDPEGLWAFALRKLFNLKMTK